MRRSGMRLDGLAFRFEIGGRLGDPGHLVEELLLAGERLHIRSSRREARRRERSGLDLGVFFRVKHILGQQCPIVVARA